LIDSIVSCRNSESPQSTSRSRYLRTTTFWYVPIRTRAIACGENGFCSHCWIESKKLFAMSGSVCSPSSLKMVRITSTGPSSAS
jgi:hypothetical protein